MCYKMHDSIMNSIEFIVELERSEYSNTKEYLEMSETIYKFCEAYYNNTFTREED